uniref:hypothetical protein n=1 Tax=Mammaliicoccus vitulinus TaxID=71237 RepID=UPI00036188A6
MNIVQQIKTLLNNHNNSEKLFVSVGHPNQKAVVKLFKVHNAERNILKYIEDFRKKSGVNSQWIKIDFVTSIEIVRFDSLKSELVNTRRNYVEYGFSLDENWKLAFLPEEINSNAFVKPKKDKKGYILSEKNINNYIKKYKKIRAYYTHKNYENEEVIKFYTKGYFLESNNIIVLEQKGYRKGLREVENLNEEIDKLIATSTEFLKNQIQDSGQYIYGYFPHFDKQIGFYNNLRHSSSTYALIEGLSYIGEDMKITKKAIDYLINNYLYEVNGAAYIFDDTKDINEIKLGQNAALIFAICEYLKNAPEEKEYLNVAQKVAKGILNMINEDQQTIHVLNYPDLTVKEQFRVVYYDGEAALALLRLYQIDYNEKWLNTVKMLFEMFIEKKYWKYHDHWLGYCTNELV